jgi:hypothetical protein
MKKNQTLLSVVLFFSLTGILNAPSFAGQHSPRPTPPPAPASTPSGTAGVAPACLDNKGHELPVDNAAMILLKTTTPNQFLARAHVSGKIGNIYPDHNGHNHFEAILGPKAGDSVELIYNQSFGALGRLVPGMTVEACGDFINSDAPTSQYPASPDNAIMHWIHKNPGGHGHASGFLIINGVVDGQGTGGNGA